MRAKIASLYSYNTILILLPAKERTRRYANKEIFAAQDAHARPFAAPVHAAGKRHAVYDGAPYTINEAAERCRCSLCAVRRYATRLPLTLVVATAHYAREETYNIDMPAKRRLLYAYVTKQRNIRLRCRQTAICYAARRLRRACYHTPPTTLLPTAARLLRKVRCAIRRYDKRRWAPLRCRRGTITRYAPRAAVRLLRHGVIYDDGSEMARRCRRAR